MIINNGIISNGNNNINILNQEFDFDKIKKELLVLMRYTNEEVQDGIKYCQNKDKSKLIEFLRKLKIETINLIKQLGLITLEQIIETLLFN